MANTELTPAQQDLSAELFNIGAIRFGDFKLKLHDQHPEAPLSPVYIDLRILRRFPDAKMAAVDVYEELVRPLKFDLLADIPTAVTPLVSSLADRLAVGMVTPRTDNKSHGSGAKIDGALEEDKGKVAVLIDDLVTRADSKLEAAAVLRTHPIGVKDMVVLIDREQGGRQQLESLGYDLHAALTMNRMLEFYASAGSITSAVYDDAVKRIDTLNKFLGI